MDSKREIYRILSPSMRLYFIFLILFIAAAAFTQQYILALAEAGAVIVLVIYSWAFWKKRKKKVINYIENAACNLGGASKGIMLDMPLPMVIFNISDGRVLWCNQAFLTITGSREHFFEISITDIVPKFDYKWLTEGKNSAPDYVHANGHIYNIYGNSVKMEDKGGQSSYWGIIYWVDLTQYVQTEKKFRDSRPVIAILLIDNYEELFKNATEASRSAILASIDSRINEWARNAKGYLSRYDRDRYIFIFEDSFMREILNGKFSILDRIREISGPGGMQATVSIGIGRGADSLEEGFHYAMLGIDMALSRGGDQAVIKNKHNFEFYGGHSLAVERRTKVKSRIMATTLGELIDDSSNLIIMGHKHSDLDCVGSAVGICCIARKKGKKAYMVINHDTTVAGPVLKKLIKLPEYSGVFISEQDAMLIADGKSLLIVVDTNRPDQVESESLLMSCNHIAVVDHHRRAAEYISNAALNFHEPYASSASELSTELLQYLVDPADLLKAEAEALLAGIVLDTKNFTMRTGSRTFEAAAFLRKAGSDTTDVKLLFQSDLPSTVAKYSIIRNAKIYRNGIAVAMMDTQEDRIIASQAADELLNITGIHTSFVIYCEGDVVNVSARSLGDVNVQFILEKLGGGGNRSMAGAQIKGKKPQEVLIDVLGAIDSYNEEEEARKEKE